MQEVTEARGQIVSWWYLDEASSIWTCALRIDREGTVLGHDLRKCEKTDAGAFRGRVREQARSTREWMRYSAAQLDLSKLTREQINQIRAHPFTKTKAWRECHKTTAEECDRQGCFFSDSTQKCTELEDRCNDAQQAGYWDAIRLRGHEAYLQELDALETRCDLPGLRARHEQRRKQAKYAAAAVGTAALAGTAAYMYDHKGPTTVKDQNGPGTAADRNSDNNNSWTSIARTAKTTADNMGVTGMLDSAAQGVSAWVAGPLGPVAYGGAKKAYNVWQGAS